MTAPAPTRTISRRAFLGGAAGVLAAAAGGGSWWALDRFVIDHVEVSNASAYEAASGADQGTTTTTNGTVDGAAYTSDQASITISTVVTGSGDATVTYFVADVVLTDATVLRSAFANDEFGLNITADPSDIAASVGAVWAVNGDYYGFRETGIVIRNGVAYRDAGAREGLAFHRDGTVRVYDETATTAAQLVADGVWNTLSFGPAIVSGGAVVAGIDSVEVDTNVGNHSIQGDQPRTAVGVIDSNHLVFVVVDGRAEGYSEGVTLPELAEIFVGLGAVTAYNIDGGGSSTMVFDGALVNDPLGKGTERGTSDVLYIA
ncbi:Tat (twin-arginine translocation) pathway signal sequence [Klenkia marina]|uniref:Tat (Twin-arginine translocation) pathway signal sequence n=1 Tax=Klenkia marina TaxID=1960309 RepID=A0A1G4XTT9_9ACTN|nr:phosphodiester glycosidase family protein [Klenkia marina]SCX44621.1 Tat (twin-arginine translocation) pathway signal sequence [Klenkia marina]